jgi:hypothetical protein
MRALILLALAGGSTALAAGCAAPAAPPTPAESRLDALRARTNAYGTFHYTAELSDGKTTVRVELGWRAPDRAFLRYGPSYAIYFTGGVGHYYAKQGYLRFDAAAELARLRKEYGDVHTGGEPELGFTLTQWEALLFGKGLRATLGLQRAGARLSWPAELRRWTPEGAVYRKDLIEMELREDGFPARVQAGSSARLEAKEVVVDAPLDDALFEPPAREGLPDLPPGARDDLLRALEDAFRRWALETDAGDATLAALVRADLARLYEPEKMTQVLKEGLDKSLETWKTENPGARAELLREKLLIDKGKTLGSVDVMEKDIQGNFERALDRTFRGMPEPPPRAFMQDVAARWRAATTREINRQIRAPFEKVFDDQMRR